MGTLYDFMRLVLGFWNTPVPSAGATGQADFRRWTRIADIPWILDAWRWMSGLKIGYWIL